MAGVQLFDIGASFRDGMQRGQATAAKREHFQSAAGGNMGALAKLAQFDPQSAQTASTLAKGSREQLMDTIGKQAGIYAQTGDVSMWRGLREGLAQAGFPADMPWDISTPEDQAGSVKFAQSIAAQFGGASEQSFRPHVVGNALVDASGKVLYQGESPEKWQLVNVPDGQGGTIQKEYSNGQWRDPTYGAAPQAVTGGGAQVLDDAFKGASVDPVQDFGALTQAFPDVQVSSLARSPEHNAKVGGVPNSYHVKGQGGDFVVPMPQRQAFMQQARNMGYDAIDEGDHVHLEPRRGVQASSRFAPGQGVAQGGPRLGYTPPKSDKQPSRQMTAQEVAAAGLPAGSVAYVGESGVPQVVHKPDAREGAGAGLPKLSAGEAAKVRRDFKETKDAFNMFRAFDQALEQIPNGAALLTDGAAKGRLGTAYNNARSSLRILYNTGVLQPGELPMLENALRDPTSFTAVMDPRTRPQIQSQLDELYRVIDRNIQNQVYSYPQIFDAQRFEQARDAKLGGSDGGKAPTITTKAQYDALPSGALFIEDGRQYRKP